MKELLDTMYIKVLLALIIIDIITGVFKALCFKRLNSSVGQKGLLKHTTTILLVVAFYPFITMVGFPFIGNFICAFYVVNYLTSVLENSAEIGVPIPKFILRTLAKIKNEMDEATDFNVSVSDFIQSGDKNIDKKEK